MFLCLAAAALFNSLEQTGSWLREEPPRAANLVTNGLIQQILSPLDASIRPLVCRYDGSKLASKTPFANGRFDGQSQTWSSETHVSPIPGEPRAAELNVTFAVTSGSANSSGVAVALDFDRWSRSNYVLVPGVVYDGNRFRAMGGGYAPEYTPDMFFNPRLPLTISNNPRLSIEPGKASKIELLTGNASTPAICVYSPGRRQGLILLSEPRTRLGSNGLFVEENSGQDRCSFVVSAPGVREHAAQFGGFADSGDLGVNWNACDRLTMRFRIYGFRADSIPALLAQFGRVRKSLTGPNHPRNLVPMSYLAHIITERFKHRWITVPAGSFYAPENDSNFQLGWVGGNMQTPLLAIDDPIERDRMGQQLDFVIRKLQAPSGFFYGGIMAGGELRSDRTNGPPLLVLTRKNADTLVCFFKFFAILEKQGHPIKPDWVRSARALADAFVRCWHRDHQFGQYLQPSTGRIAVYNSTSGAIAPTGLAMAGRYFHDPTYTRVAAESATFYFKRDVVDRGFTSGACGDISQDPDSETAFGFLESLMALYWSTGDPAWLARASVEADLAATWVLSYDEEFPPTSDIAKIHGHMAGAVFASAQNKHAAPGICTSSGDYLFKLYRATGQIEYANLIRDIQHAHVEATEMPGHPTCGTGYGASMERIQPTDGEGKGAIGMFIHTQNAWTELDGLMMATELPGVYVRTDKRTLFVFDHVDAKIVKGGHGLALQIHNPTPYPADVSVFAEDEAMARVPLSYTAYLRWPKIAIGAGKTRFIQLDSNSRAGTSHHTTPDGMTVNVDLKANWARHSR